MVSPHRRNLRQRNGVQDALWWVHSASHWYWGTEYSWIAFVRPPAYALFIALVHSCALPLRFGIEIAQMAGYLVLVTALRKAGVPRLVCVASYAAMILHPASQFNRCTMADTFYAAILPLSLGGLLLILFTGKPTHAIWTGIAFAVLWNTREESFLIPPLLIFFFAFALFRQRSIVQSWKAAAFFWLKPASLMLGTLLLFNLAVDAANYRTFGSFSKSDMTSSSYQAAFKALLRIKPRTVQRFVPISMEALETAYRVSPTFAQLKPQFDGELGRAWQVPTFAALGVHEVGPWFMWAFRSAADAEGFHKSAKSAKRFYSSVAEEINRACDEGQIPSRRVYASFLDPGAMPNVRNMPHSLHRMASLFVLPFQRIADREDGTLHQSQRALYDEMTHRRTAYRRAGTLNIVGWAFQFGDPVKSIAYQNGFDEIEASTDRLSEGPDVVQRFATDGDVPRQNRFSLSVDLFRTDGVKGDLVFITQSGTEYRAEAAAVLAGGPLVVDGKSLMCHIDSQEVKTPPASLSAAFADFIGNSYRFLVLGLSLVGVGGGGVIIGWHHRQLQVSAPLSATLILLTITIVVRVLFFAFLDATWWEGDYERYVFPVMPLYSCFLILLIYQAQRLHRSRTVRKG